ncbi:aldehyde dehydrogenase [Xylogone sp. PMI_703]|nr:aldehyde dehydrogenase [Xylogone sp. PMI_703]
MYQTKLFINNEYVSATSGKTLEVRNPMDDSLVVSDVQVASPEDVNAAVKAACDAFTSGPWPTFTGTQRAACLMKFADLLEENCERLASLEGLAMGQPISLSKQIVGGMVPPFWRYYAGWCDKLGGEMFPEDGDNFYKIIRYEPIGPCAAVIPWNGTQLAVAWKIAPAVAAGNTIVLKSSEKSPLGVLALGELVVKAGFPPGVINFITGAGETGRLLAEHMDIRKISFTGSTATGRKIQEAAARSNLKIVTLELGGKSPSLIFNDADIESALTHTTHMLMNSGQVCAAATRVLVQEDIAPAFIKEVKVRFEAMKQTMGDTKDPKTFVGPLADKAQYDRVMGLIEQGKTAGAELLTGGSRYGDAGYYVEPTIFVNPPSDNPVYREEIFGPVLSIKTFKTDEEALALANDTTYGLSSSIFTANITRALRLSAKLQAGMVTINSAPSTTVNTPFGGVKQSGLGRESGKHGLMAYLEPKTILINMGK